MRAYLLEMFGSSLALTIVAEMAVIFAMCSIFPEDSGSAGSASVDAGRPYWREKALLVMLVNVLTNPLAVLLCWLGRLYLPTLPQIAVQLAVEGAVTAAEGLVYCSFAKRPEWGIRRPVLLAVAANACSWLLGMFVSA